MKGGAGKGEGAGGRVIGEGGGVGAGFDGAEKGMWFEGIGSRVFVAVDSSSAGGF